MATRYRQASKYKVVFITSSNSGIAFYRMWQFRENMKEQGLADTVIPWFNYDELTAQEWQWHVHDDFRVYSGNEKLGVIAPACAWADVVVVQYLHTIEALCLIEALKASLPFTPFLTEIDDDIIDTPTSNAAFDCYSPGSKYREVVIEQLKALDGVICSTPYLAEKYKEFNPFTYVVPNCIDIPKWDKIPKLHAKDEVRIGWAGGATHDDDLRTIEAPMKAFLANHKNVSFHIVHGVPDFFKDQSKVVCHKWWSPINKYPKMLGKMKFDIGIAPLKPCAFNLGKSNLRKLEYAGLHVPVIAQNTGEFARTVHHGKDGFLYNNSDEFYKYLEMLYSDAKLRKKMGEANYEDVKENFNVDKVSRDYIAILKEVKERGQTTVVDVSDRSKREGKWTEPAQSALQA